MVGSLSHVFLFAKLHSSFKFSLALWGWYEVALPNCRVCVSLIHACMHVANMYDKYNIFVYMVELLL